MNKSHYWSADQKARWAEAERREGCKLPRTHQNCLAILKVARPGKTAKDKARNS
jgi:hypothetical protein